MTGDPTDRHQPTADPDTLEQRTQELAPEHAAEVLADPEHDGQTAAEAAEQADPGVTGAHSGA